MFLISDYSLLKEAIYRNGFAAVVQTTNGVDKKGLDDDVKCAIACRDFLLDLTGRRYTISCGVSYFGRDVLLSGIRPDFSIVFPKYDDAVLENLRVGNTLLPEEAALLETICNYAARTGCSVSSLLHNPPSLKAAGVDLSRIPIFKGYLMEQFTAYWFRQELPDATILCREQVIFGRRSRNGQRMSDIDVFIACPYPDFYDTLQYLMENFAVESNLEPNRPPAVPRKRNGGSKGYINRGSHSGRR